MDDARESASRSESVTSASRESLISMPSAERMMELHEFANAIAAEKGFGRRVMVVSPCSLHGDIEAEEGQAAAMEELRARTPQDWKWAEGEFFCVDLAEDQVKPPPLPAPIEPTYRLEARHGGPNMATWFIDYIRSIFCPRPSKHSGGWRHHGFTADQRRARRRRERDARSAHYRRCRATA